MLATRLDLKTVLRELYRPPSNRFVTVEVPPLQYLMIDGKGDPNTSSAFQAAMQALYAVSYTLKFAVKRQQAIDYTVMPSEGLWWSDQPGAFASGQDMSQASWTLMIVQPDCVTPALVAEAIAAVAKKKAPHAAALRLETLHEGLSLQKMHIGPYETEWQSLRQLYEVIMPEMGVVANGRHHEIYLSDPRRSAPERMRTILRQPVRKV